MSWGSWESWVTVVAMVTFFPFAFKVETSLITRLPVSLELGILSANYKCGGSKGKIPDSWTDSTQGRAVWIGCKNSRLANTIRLRALIVAEMLFWRLHTPCSPFLLLVSELFWLDMCWSCTSPLAQMLPDIDFGLTDPCKLGCILRVESA